MKKPAEFRLTTVAARHAERHGLSDMISTLPVPENIAVGDLISVEAGGKTHDFAVIRRRWIFVRPQMLLELTLDHPASGRS